MDDYNKNITNDKLNIRFLGRLGQAYIYFRKFARVFIHQNDWLTIPMAALIAGLVSLALGAEFGVTREGTLMGVFAFMCVCIWNGTFNSIQIICRERDVVKREHRSGLHMSSYIMAHMAFQAIICLIQSIVTISTAAIIGMRVTGDGLFFTHRAFDVVITLFLITYAADMLALFISAVVRTTTIAMTIMPFVLIYQMVFSGGLFPLPDNISIISKTTVSAPAFDCLASQMNASKLPYKAIDSMIDALDDAEMDVEFKGSDIINMLSNTEDESINQLRAIKVGGEMTAEEVCNLILTDNRFKDLRNETIIKRITVGNVLDDIANSNENKILDIKNTTINGATTIREAMQYVLTNNDMEEARDSEIVEGVSLKQLLSSVIVMGDDIEFIGDALNAQVEGSITIGEIIDFIRSNQSFDYLNDVTLLNDTTLGEALKILMSSSSFKDSLNSNLSYFTTVGEIIDYLNTSPQGEEYKNLNIVYHVKFSDVLDKLGKEDIMKIVEHKAASSLFTKDYENTKENILADYLHLCILIFISVIAAIIALEFIDKDKR